WRPVSAPASTGDVSFISVKVFRSVKVVLLAIKHLQKAGRKSFSAGRGEALKAARIILLLSVRRAEPTLHSQAWRPAPLYVYHDDCADKARPRMADSSKLPEISRMRVVNFFSFACD